MTVNKIFKRHNHLRRFLRPLPVAVVVTAFGVAQHYRSKKHEIEFHEAKQWEVTCYCSVPLRITSRMWGWISNKQLPMNWRERVYSKYASFFGVNIEEAVSQDLTTYPSLCDFFCRALRDGIRPINLKESVVSPADGKVLTAGKVTSAQVEQVKGVTYSLKAFFGHPSWKEASTKELKEGTKPDEEHNTSLSSDYINSLLENKENCLYQCVVYLAPGDYHRFHSPVDWCIKFRRHFQGELLSVNPKIAHWIPNLFSLNERAVYVGQWKHGFFSFTAVGATNVGSIHVFCDESLKTNQRKWHGNIKYKDFHFADIEEDGVPMSKGDLFGEFRMGSTIVLIFEAPPDFQFHISPGHVIKVGQAVSHSVQ